VRGRARLKDYLHLPIPLQQQWRVAKPTAHRIAKRASPTKAARADHLPIVRNSSSLPEKTQNVMSPTGGIKKDII